MVFLEGNSFFAGEEPIDGDSYLGYDSSSMAAGEGAVRGRQAGYGSQEDDSYSGDPEWVRNNPATVAPEDVALCVTSPLSEDETEILEEITDLSEIDRVTVEKIEVSDTRAAVSFVRLGLYPQQADYISFYEPEGNITIKFFKHEEDEEIAVGEINISMMKFANGTCSVTNDVGFTGLPEFAKVYLSGEEIATRMVSGEESEAAEKVGISEVFRTSESNLVLRIVNEDPEAIKDALHYYRVCIYKVGEDRRMKLYSGTRPIEVIYGDGGWTFTPKYSISNLTEGVVEIRSLSGNVLATKEFKF